MNKKRFEILEARYARGDDFKFGGTDMQIMVHDIQELIAAVERLQAELVEAQRTIKIAYSDVPDKVYDAEATLEYYMEKHNLEEWR